MKMQGAPGAEQLPFLGVDIEDLRQRTKFHPLIDGVKDNVGIDGELRAHGQDRVGPVDDRLVRHAASMENRCRSSPWDGGPHLRVGPGGTQCVRQPLGALDEPGAEYGRVLIGVPGDVADLFVGWRLRRPGPHDRLDPTVTATEMPQQLTDGPAGAGRHRSRQVRALDAGPQQVGLRDDSGAVAVVAQAGLPGGGCAVRRGHGDRTRSP
jgi:hypothetical protein